MFRKIGPSAIIGQWSQNVLRSFVRTWKTLYESRAHSYWMCFRVSSATPSILRVTQHARLALLRIRVIATFARQRARENLRF